VTCDAKAEVNLLLEGEPGDRHDTGKIIARAIAVGGWHAI
jgi:hypothetical protein